MIDSAFSRRFPFMALAWRNLTRAKARSLLAMAGIAIGVVAIASLGMFGAAFEQSQINNAEDTIRTVGVFPGEDAETNYITRDQVQRIERNAGSGEVHPVKSSFARVVGLDGTSETSVYGLQEPRAFVSVADGRIPSNWRDGAVVGSQLADNVGVQAGDSVTVDGENYRVVAVLDESSRASWLGTDDAVLLPPEQMGTRGYSRVLIRHDSPRAAFDTADRMEQTFNGREEQFLVSDAESALERFNRLIGQINTFLLGIGGVSLLVASVSILNVMLMSTIERKEEIGVMRAVGYRRLDVLRLMLNEAALLGIVGAVFGVILSFGLGMLINAEFLSDPLAFTADAILYAGLGFVFGTLASFLSGLYPAWKAANARPVEALRD